MQTPFQARFFLPVLALCAGAALPQPAAQTDFEPSVGQDGKDVVWVPTPQALVDKMLAMARFTPNDHLIDLGSGDGRTVIIAAKRGVRALGIEYNLEMVEQSRRNAQKEGAGERASFVKTDLFETSLSKATVISMFLLDRIGDRVTFKAGDIEYAGRAINGGAGWSATRVRSPVPVPRKA